MVKKKSVKRKTVRKKVSKKKTVKKASKKKSVVKASTSKSSSKPDLRDEKDVAMDFAAEVHKRFENLVKATILFGSQTKGTATTGSDIDIIIVVDDAAIRWDLKLVAWYREELGKMISSKDYGRELHVNTVKLTTWWNDLMHGDPVIINILRYGEALIDIGGFFNPVKALLLQGKIHSTPEAVYAALQRAPNHLARSEGAQLGAIEGVYWTMVDSAQAALITLGKLPPSPEHIPGMLNDLFVETDLLKKEYVNWYKAIFNLHKSISHGEGMRIKGIEIDDWQDKAKKFMGRMTEIIDMLLEAKKDNVKK